MRKNSRHFIRQFLAKELFKHPFMVPAIAIPILSVISLFGIVLLGSNSYGSGESHVVQLSVEGERKTLPTRAVTVGDFLKRVDIQLNDSDVVEPSVSTVIDADDFRINVYRAKPVTILDGNRRIQALSAATTPRSIAAQAGVSVHPEDNIDFASPQEVIRDQVLGAELIIDRAIKVNLLLYGNPITIRTHASTVSELLAEKNIVLSNNETLSPAPKTPIKEGLVIQVNREGTKIATETESIPNTIEYVDDNSLSFGTTAVRQAGSPGRKSVVYEIKLKNGKEVSRKRIQEVVIRKPINKIIARGKAIFIPEDKSVLMAAAGIASSDYPYANYIISQESGWCPTKWQGQIGYCPPYYEPIHSPDSGFGYGLCQSTPGSKMAEAGSDWQTSAVTQLKWCSGYATGRYGGWAGAYEFWSANHWW